MAYGHSAGGDSPDLELSAPGKALTACTVITSAGASLRKDYVDAAEDGCKNDDEGADRQF